MVTDLDVFVNAADRVILEMSLHKLCYIIQGVKLLIVLHEEVGVNFVDENFKCDVWVNFVSDLDNFKQFVAASIFVLLMCINNIYQGPALPKCLNITWVVFSEFFSTRKILNLELNIRVVIHIGRFNLLSTLKEECLVRTHFLKYYSLNTCFT